jgi:hypothetical protein
MRRWHTLWIAVAAAWPVISTAHGQALQGTRFTDPAVLVLNPAVLRELGIEDDKEVQKLRQIPILIRQKAEEEIQALKEIKEKDPKEFERRRQEVRKRTMEAGEQQLERVLQPEQMKRLRQIALQMHGFQGLQKPDVTATLHLTDAQEQQIKQLIAAGNAEMLDRVKSEKRDGGGNLEQMWKLTQPVRTATLAKAVALLDSKQKATWDDLVGEPFDFSLNRPGKDLIPRGGGPAPATAAQKSDPRWVAERVRDWQPRSEEKGFDRIVWQTKLCEATKLAERTNRCLFIFVVDGVVGTGRC